MSPETVEPRKVLLEGLRKRLAVTACRQIQSPAVPVTFRSLFKREMPKYESVVHRHAAGLDKDQRKCTLTPPGWYGLLI